MASMITGSIGEPAMPPAALISSIAYCMTSVESSSGTARPPVSENRTPTLIGLPSVNVAPQAPRDLGIHIPGAASAPAIAEVFRNFRLLNFIFLFLSVGFSSLPAGCFFAVQLQKFGNHPEASSSN
ncbi:hypothetical protein RV134_190168 [Roseovarius sp. EC-HK134]|nr:hypothetical protein RV134_190168 [Roseovarius sp. EC-HK134]VVS98800.1 hypothetical protein RV420_220016 [Roseovarius sp. EC-SD190]